MFIAFLVAKIWLSVVTITLFHSENPIVGLVIGNSFYHCFRQNLSINIRVEVQQIKTEQLPYIDFTPCMYQ